MRRDDRATDQIATTTNGNGHRDLDLDELRPPKTTADRLRPWGRVALWLVLGIIFARGLSQIINPTEPVNSSANATVSWPDPAAEAFALDFARTYFSFSGKGDPDELTELHNTTIERYFTPDLRGDVAGQAELPGQGVEQLYYAGEIAGVETVDPDHALITVEALISQSVPPRGNRAEFSGQKRVFLIVPVGRDGGGHVAVYAHPAVVAEPPTGSPDTLETATISEPGAAEIEDLVERFLADYLSGAEAGELNFYLAPGTQLPPLEGGYRLIEAQSVDELDRETTSDDRRALLVTASVRDQTTDVIYTWQYLIDVEQRDRWYVTGIEGAAGLRANETAAAEGDAANGGPASENTSEPEGSQ